MSNSTPFVTTQVRKQSIRFLPAHTPSPPIASDGVVHVSTIVQRLAAANLSDQADTATVSSLLSPTPKTPLDLMAIASIPESEEVDMSRKSTPSPSPTAIPGPALDAEYDKLLSSYDLLKGPHSIFTG
jgi:hypothetical protein